jgi:tetratricopeptide (TPR) repeat protein
MQNERLAQLFKFLEEDPQDPFTLYAIAMEYEKIKPLEALGYYERLLNEHEDYVGTYYHAAKLYAVLGKPEEAEATFKKGLLIAQKHADRHAHRELQNAYNEFLFEEDED